MIGWLGGTVRLRDPKTGEVVLDVAGVGYQALVSLQTLAHVPEVGERCELWIHTHVREDVLSLFGFANLHERRMYRLLVSVPQVGPRNAVAVLGGFPLVELCEAIAGGHRGMLEKVPGVGKRTAERILVDLQDKIGPLLEALDAQQQPKAAAKPDDDGLRDEARAVLVNLGWKAKAVDTALGAVQLGPTRTLDAVVRQALAALMG